MCYIITYITQWGGYISAYSSYNDALMLLSLHNVSGGVQFSEKALRGT